MARVGLEVRFPERKAAAPHLAPLLLLAVVTVQNIGLTAVLAAVAAVAAAGLLLEQEGLETLRQFLQAKVLMAAMAPLRRQLSVLAAVAAQPQSAQMAQVRLVAMAVLAQHLVFLAGLLLMLVAAGAAAHRKALLEERAALAAVETVMDREALPLDQTGLLTLAAAAAAELVQHFIPAALAS